MNNISSNLSVTRTSITPISRPSSGVSGGTYPNLQPSSNQKNLYVPTRSMGGPASNPLVLRHNGKKDLEEHDASLLTKNWTVPQKNILTAEEKSPQNIQNLAHKLAEKIVDGDFSGTLVHQGHSMITSAVRRNPLTGQKMPEQTRTFAENLRYVTPSSFYALVADHVKTMGGKMPDHLVLSNCYMGDKETMIDLATKLKEKGFGDTKIYAPRFKVKSVEINYLAQTGEAIRVGENEWDDRYSGSEKDTKKQLWSIYQNGELIDNVKQAVIPGIGTKKSIANSKNEEKLPVIKKEINNRPSNNQRQNSRPGNAPLPTINRIGTANGTVRSQPNRTERTPSRLEPLPNIQSQDPHTDVASNFWEETM